MSQVSQGDRFLDSFIQNVKAFAFSAENPTGTRAGGSRGGDCTKLFSDVTIHPGGL